MTQTQQILTIISVILGTMTTRFLPFLIFRSESRIPQVIKYLGKVLPAAVFGFLVIYCLKSVNISEISSIVPQLLAVIMVAALHIWRRQMLLSIAGGTIFYMVLVQLVF